MVVGPFKPATRRPVAAVSGLAASSWAAAEDAGADSAVAASEEAADEDEAAPQPAREIHRAAAVMAAQIRLQLIMPVPPYCICGLTIL